MNMRIKDDECQSEGEERERGRESFTMKLETSRG
jgi:hypothetical protein